MHSGQPSLTAVGTETIYPKTVPIRPPTTMLTVAAQAIPTMMPTTTDDRTKSVGSTAPPITF